MGNCYAVGPNEMMVISGMYDNMFFMSKLIPIGCFLNLIIMGVGVVVMMMMMLYHVYHIYVVSNLLL